MISPRVYRQFTEIINNDFIQAHLSGSHRRKGAHSVSEATRPILSPPGSPRPPRVRPGLHESIVPHSTPTNPAVLFSVFSYGVSVETALKGLLLLLGVGVLTALKLVLTIVLVGKIAVRALAEQQAALEAESNVKVPDDKGVGTGQMSSPHKDDSMTAPSETLQSRLRGDTEKRRRSSRASVV